MVERVKRLQRREKSYLGYLNNFSTKMETDDSGHILGKRGRVDSLNSSKKNMEQIKKLRS